MDRQDCGFKGISEDQCRQRKCCWDSSTSDPKIPWCYNQKALVNICPTNKDLRTECGFKGISQEE
ncbi:hypothetical protein BGZ74_011342, partial [Mortierella antarctica]